MTPFRPRSFVACLSVLTLLAPPAPAQQTWTGGGATGNWNDAANWSGGIPVSSTAAVLVFAGANNLTTNQNIATTFDLNSLTFDATAGPFIINGGALRFGANGTTAPQLLVNTARSEERRVGN